MKVIHDGDGAYEDVMALILLLLNTELKAVTVVYGESNTEAGALNMARVCRFLKPELNIPVAYGRNEALNLEAGTPFPEFIHTQADHVLAGTDVSQSEDVVVETSAVELLRRTLMESDEKITIVATGPLTNIAELLRAYPECQDNIEQVVIMGGAVRVPGNIYELLPHTSNTVSEWNLYADPVAAKEVLESTLKLRLVPLDITAQMPMTRAFYEGLRNTVDPALKLTFDMLTLLKNAVNNDERFFKLQFWDSLTSMICLDPELATFENLALRVDAETGQTIEVADAEPNVEVAMILRDPALAYQRYVSLLSTAPMLELLKQPGNLSFFSSPPLPDSLPQARASRSQSM